MAMALIREIFGRTFGAVAVLVGIGMIGFAAWSIYDSGRWSYLGAVLLGATFLAVGWPRLFPDAFAPMAIDPNDPFMPAAIQRARSEVDRLRRGVREGRKQAYLKFPLKVQGEGSEHIWGVVHAIERDTATVTLVNEPVGAMQNEDPRIKVDLNELEDWMLTASDGVSEGGYSHKAMAQIYKREKGHLPRAVRKMLEKFTDIRLEEI